MAEDADDEEWGWGDGPNQSPSVEMSRTGERSIKNSPLHRRSVSPGTAARTAAPTSGANHNFSRDRPPERKGFSVKKAGMNNPLHPPQHQPPVLPQSSSSTGSSSRQGVVQKLAPSAGDFFAEMGVVPTKPKFGAAAAAATPRSATSSKRLGAKALPMDDTDDDDDMGTGADWDTDADLDDLLDD